MMLSVNLSYLSCSEPRWSNLYLSLTYYSMIVIKKWVVSRALLKSSNPPNSDICHREVLAFDQWVVPLTKSMPLANLANCAVGVDAAYYLDGYLAPSVKESLLSALGGFPLALEQTIIKDLNALRTAGLKLHFVFNGLDHGTVDDPFGPSILSARANAAAFKTYDADMANEAIIEFKKTGTRRSRLKPTIALLIECAGSPTAAALSEFFKKILHEHEVPFTVAPYSALAQVRRDPSSLFCH